MKKQTKPKTIEEYPDILTLTQACELLNCHRNTLRSWDNKGLLKAIRFGTRGDRRFRKEEVVEILKRK